MARGPKKHLKRIRTPKSWLLDKLTGVYAPRPRTGPHKLRECLPLMVVLRNRLKYALNGTDCYKILNEKDNQVKIDGRVRRDVKYPVGLMDVITIILLALNLMYIKSIYFSVWIVKGLVE